MLKKYCCAIFLTLSFLPSLPALGAGLDAEPTLSFADALFAEGDHYRAITEYKRYLHRAPQGGAAPRAALRIGESYLAGERWEQADEALRRVRLGYPESPQAQKAFLLRAQSAYGQDDFAETRLRLREVPDSGLSDAFRARLRYLLAWSYLEEYRIEEAQQQLRHLADATSRELASKLPEFGELPRKSPKLAGGLSAVLPGAGQLYVGRHRDAALAFLLNAAFIFGIVESFDDGNEVVGSILLFFEAGWYTGNIFNAANGAHKFNRDIRQEYLEGLRPRFGLGLDLEADQARLQLKLKF